jgi:hypothetical protein
MWIVSARDKSFPSAAQKQIRRDKDNDDSNAERDDDQQEIGTARVLMRIGKVIRFRIHTE